MSVKGKIFDVSPWTDTETKFISIGSRFYDIFVPQETLQGAVQAAETVLGSVVDFTIIPDERNAARAYGFLVELDGEIGQ